MSAIELGRRAVACKRWRYLAGMRTLDGDRIIRAPHLRGDQGCGLVWAGGGPCDGYAPCPVCDYDEFPDGALPDFDDPATLGCLLALVREAWGESAHLVRRATHDQPGGPGTDFRRALWWALAVGDASVALIIVCEDGTQSTLSGPTEAEALVVALEAAR